MNFVKLAVTTYETGSTTPAAGADDIWINLDQVVTAEEHLGSNTFNDGACAGWKAAEYYPCVLLTTSDGSTHLVPVGVYPDQESAFRALVNFMPLVLGTESTLKDDGVRAAVLD
jgi:hypothetical protein